MLCYTPCGCILRFITVSQCSVSGRAEYNLTVSEEAGLFGHPVHYAGSRPPAQAGLAEGSKNSQMSFPFGDSPPNGLGPQDSTSERYWVESRRPLASLLFIMPLLVVYEVGATLGGAHQNGADAFLRQLLEWVGFGQHFLLPVLTLGILLAWHYLAHDPWRFSGRVLSGMAIESVLLGVCLQCISWFQNALVALSLGGRLQDAVSFLGAGIYEELLFRLILLSLAAWAFRRAGLAPRTALISAILLSSVLFSAAHHVGPYGEKLEAHRLLFRFVAGVFFSLLFIYRGFGIAAGSHAAYDILVGVLG
jgi:hypothetical protein